MIGKAMVPIIEESDGQYWCRFQGANGRTSADELEALEARINFNGLYPVVLDREEGERFVEDADYREKLFAGIIEQQIEQWCDLAAERLADEKPCIITPGNDDPELIDRILREHPRIKCPERAVTELGPIWLASLGNTNYTPWHTEREFSEEELAQQIDAMLGGYDDGRPLVFNFHCPPYNSGLDTAMELTEELRPVIKNGIPVEIAVGSTAVAEAITKYQPIVGLHGHIHEAPGVCRIGRAICVNPGSDYSSGVLKGTIVDFDTDGQYITHLMASG